MTGLGTHRSPRRSRPCVRDRRRDITLGEQTHADPVDGESLALAQGTGGEAYTTASGRNSSAVYADIGSSVGITTERQEVTG